MTKKQEMPGRRVSALGLALLVALAFGAIAASGAQALDWQHQSGTTVLSGTSSETVAGTGSGFTIASTLLGQSVEVKCSSASTSGSIVGGGTGSSNIGLGGCTVAKPSPKCSLASQPTLSAKVELVQVDGVLFQKFVPAGTEFARIEFTGAECPLNEASAPIKGSFAGRELSGSLAANHSLSFTKSEPWPAVALTFGTKAATLTGEVTQHLSGNMANHGWRSIWQETHGGWEVEGSAFASSESASVSGGPVKFSFTIAGSPISFSCSESSASSATLKPGGTESVNGLTFSSCIVEKPTSACSLPSNQVQFAGVTGTLTRVNGKVYEKFAASSPEGTITTLSFQGGSCPLAGNQYAVKGTFAGLGTEFGMYKATQPLEFSQAANEATGSQLKIGSNVGVTMAGTVSQSLFLKGNPWGAY